MQAVQQADIVPVTRAGLDAWLARAPASQARWVRQHGFQALPGRHIVVPGMGGDQGIGVVLVATSSFGLFTLGDLPAALPAGIVYSLEGRFDRERATALSLGWALGNYRFERYREARPRPHLVWPDGTDIARVEAIAESVRLGRDLINTPAEDMGPGELAEAVEALGRDHDARVRIVAGDELLAAGYPAIHAVGRASSRAPRLIDLAWGDPEAPQVALVGKGVCFDSGGLDLKPAAAMQPMKKDMAGAASAIALAAMVMRLGLPVRLRLLVPAVDNAVAGNAYRPLDVIPTRQGTAIEIGNTDAEGRVILADALAEASSDRPDLLLDLATLTGAARAALGPELPALFSNDDTLANEIEAAGRQVEDELWRLPLWPGYRRLLESDTAPLSTTGREGTAGAILAALFLERFVGEGIAWAHIDLMGWNTHARPGRPKGGEVMAARCLLAMLERRYGRARAGTGQG